MPSGIAVLLVASGAFEVGGGGYRVSRACNGPTMLKAVTINEIEKIFTVLERLEISREAVIIPLRPATPGSVQRLPNGKFEIIVDAVVPLDDWLPTLEEQLRGLMGQ